MENIIRFVAIMLLLTGSFSSCSEGKEYHVDEDCSSINIVHDESASIIGKWKLVKERKNFYNVTCNDYSSHNIVYEFKENNVLTVSAKSGTPEMLPDETGEYSYTIFEEGVMEYDGRTLKIDNSYYWHSISSGSKELIIDQSPLDGSTLYLTKIQ